MLSQHLLRSSAGLLLLLAACSPQSQHEGRGHENDSPPVVVRVGAPESSGRAAVVLPARAKAAEEITIAARLQGTVTRFGATEGERVSLGQTLVHFAAPELQRALAAARSAEESAATARLMAVRHRARIESLFVGGVSPISDRDVMESALRAAEASLAEATARREQLESSAAVRAPFAGVIVRRHVDAGADVSPGTPLLDLRSGGAVEIVTSLPEQTARFAERAEAEIQIEDGPWRPARLLRLEGMVDPTTRSRVGRFVAVDAEGIEPGAFARVRITYASDVDPSIETRLRVPRASIVRRGALTGVFVVEEGRARLRWLQLGREEAGMIDVLSGLDPSARIVLDATGVTDGVRIEARP